MKEDKYKGQIYVEYAIIGLSVIALYMLLSL